MQRPEAALHRAIVQHLMLRLPKPWLFWHTPNQGERPTQRIHGLRKAMGVRAGIPDLFIAGEGRMIGVELKAPPAQLKRGPSKAKPRLSEAQADTIAALAEAGIPTLVVRSWEELETALKAMGVPVKGRSL